MQNNENEREQARIRQEIANLNQTRNEIINDATLPQEQRNIKMSQNQDKMVQMKQQLADLQKKQNQLQTQRDYRWYEQQSVLRSRILQLEGKISELSDRPRPELTTENLAGVI